MNFSHKMLLKIKERERVMSLRGQIKRDTDYGNNQRVRKSEKDKSVNDLAHKITVLRILTVSAIFWIPTHVNTWLC